MIGRLSVYLAQSEVAQQDSLNKEISVLLPSASSLASLPALVPLAIMALQRNIHNRDIVLCACSETLSKQPPEQSSQLPRCKSPNVAYQK